MWLDTTKYCCERRPNDRTLSSQAPSLAPAVKTRILFVDDEPSMLRVLKLGMRSKAAVWDAEFAGSGEEALALIQQQPYDVVVSDMRMSGINGAQLLNHVLRRHPQTVRIILSGYADLSEVVTCVGLTHQFLDKPCSLEDLQTCLGRVTEAKSRLASQKLRALAGGMKMLPSLPELYLQITEALQSPNTSAQRIAEIAGRDPAISAKLLQLSNSAFFGFRHKVFSVDEAVQLLGVGIIQTLALAVPIFSAFSRGKCPSFPIDQLWEHSVQTGVIGRRMAGEHLSDSFLGEHAFCAGVLHDIGKLMLAEGLPAEYTAVLKEARETGAPLFELEQKYFEATHADMGGYLLALWGLPIPLVEAVANHHRPHRCGLQQLCLAGLVHMANALQHAGAVQPEIGAGPVDADYLKAAGLDREFETWRAELSAEAAESAG